MTKWPSFLVGCIAAVGVVDPFSPASSCAPKVDRTVETGHVIGDLRQHEFESRIYGNTRHLRVLLPPGYDQPANRDRRYPVLYLNDGQNLFDSSTAIFSPTEWRVDETISALVAAGEIRPLIVVGIDNAGRTGRAKEYLPYVDEHLRPPEPDPRGKLYPSFLVEEVKTFIDARYRTLRSAEHTGLGGSSYGGLISLYTVVARPGVFGALLVESPSLYVSNGDIFREAAHVLEWPERVYLGVGTNEEGRPACRADATTESEAVEDVRRLARLLEEHGLDASRLRTVVEPCATHNEDAWAARLPVALRFLFGE